MATASPIGTHLLSISRPLISSSCTHSDFSLQTYGAQVDQLHADFGGTIDAAQVEQALQSKKYKIVTITHVDTSTGAYVPSLCSKARLHSLSLGVLSNPQPVADAVRRVSPETLVILDAVCAVASEEIQMDSWGIDVVLTASQKGLGAPPGLSIVIASQKAMKVKFVRAGPGTALTISSRFLRRDRNRSRHSMPAGRGKTIQDSSRVPFSPYHADGSPL